MFEALASYTDPAKLIEALKESAKKTPGATDSQGSVDSFCLGYLAAYVALINAEALDQAANDEPRELTETEIDELLVNVSIAKLERLLHERRCEMADTPEDLEATLFGDPGFPRVNDLELCVVDGCNEDRAQGGIYCLAHLGGQS